MTARPKAQQSATAAGDAPKTARRWLLFLHQLPSTPSNLRVRTWRRLQQLGALPVKQAIYALPDTPTTREDFEWLRTEIKAAGGDASVFAADAVDQRSDDDLVEAFRRSRQEAYGSLIRDVERTLRRLDATRRSLGTRAPAVRRLTAVFKERLAAIEQIDFFGSAGRDRVATLLKQLEVASSEPRRSPPQSPATIDVQDYLGRIWVTRPRPGVDRMASAWLIRRFIDPQARFGFAADRDAVLPEAVPFDMFGVAFTHQGEGCTFETLCATFGIQGPAVARVAAIVHDLDLKDGRFGAPEAPTVGTVIEGMQFSVSEDDDLLAQGMALFESLYRAFERSARSAGPRPIVRARTTGPLQRSKTATRRRRKQ